MTSQKPLSVELAWFEDHRKELFEKYPEKWIAVSGGQSLGIYDSFSKAYQGGSKTAAPGKLLVKQILLKDEVFSAPALSLGLLSANF